MSSIPERIFNLLDEKGLEQKEFAKLIGTSDKTVSAWKTGRAKSYSKYLSQIAEALDTSVDYLINGNTEIIRISHELPAQGSLDKLLKNGSNMAKVLFQRVREFADENLSVKKQLDSPTCALCYEMSFYDPATESMEKPIILTEDGLSTEEKALIRTFRHLTSEQQEMVIRMVQAAADKL